MIIRIPKRFFDDHMERGLPTPSHRDWRGGYAVRVDDPDLGELVDDARHYAHDGCDCGPALKRAAEALLNAIAKATGAA